MAKRVAVVLAQTQFSDPSKRKFEEELVTTLLLEDNIEVTLVPHLENLDPDGTGLLCLEGINSDMILCAWEEPAQSVRQMLGYGFDGVQGRTSFTSGQILESGRGKRIIYAIDNDGLTVPQLREEVLRIRDEAQEQVFNIVGLMPPSPQQPETPPPASQPPVSQPPASQPPASQPPASQPPASQPPSPQPPVPPQPKAEARQPDPESPADDDEAMEQELDQLLDDFDALDL